MFNKTEQKMEVPMQYKRYKFYEGMFYGYIIGSMLTFVLTGLVIKSMGS